MSFRTWLGEGKVPYADYNLEEYTSMLDLCKDAAWNLPAKVISPTPETLMDFLEEMRISHCMHPKEFYIYLGKFGGDTVTIEADTLEQAEKLLGVPRKRRKEDYDCDDYEEPSV